MIEGLRVTISGEELRTLCRTHMDYHRERAAMYAQKIKGMEKDRVEGMEYTDGDPIKNLEDRKRRHEGEADELEFIGDHLDLSENYVLDRSDLNRLGICKSKY